MPRATLVSIIGIALATQVTAAQSAFPSDSAIRSILVDRIDTQHQSVGIVVGLIEPGGRRIISYGALAKDDARPLDGNTIFEIGSVTKTFTSLLLADMVRRGEVALDDPVAKYLPADVRMPSRKGRAITLVDLATHSSGLPHVPANLKPKDVANPWADYTVQQLYAFLSSYVLPRDIGSEFEYSNLGAGLLGHILARRAGMEYEDLVRTRITDPLGMSSTRVTVPSDWTSRFATGHDDRMRTVSYWDLPTLAGAAALRSTANDMLTFLAANIGLTNSPLTPAMTDMLRISRPGANPGLTMGLGWMVEAEPPPSPQFVWHNGGTGGFRSFVGFDPARHIGVVVLSNASTLVGVDDIGGHLFNEESALLHLQPPRVRTEVAIDSTLLAPYVGTYGLPAGRDIKVGRLRARLYAQATGQSSFEVYAEGPRDFFAKVADIQMRFETDAGGKVTAMVITQAGFSFRARRVP